jgi:hypothetical protein
LREAQPPNHGPAGPVLFVKERIIEMDQASEFPWMLVVKIVGSLVVLVTAWILIGYPRWRVWAAHQDGLADLAKANNEQQIQISKAKARKDAANLNKEAAIIEAEAVAEQIDRIGQQLTNHDLYLRWQWIKMMEDTHSEDDQRTVIYVPTESQLPILEARRKV